MRSTILFILCLLCFGPLWAQTSLSKNKNVSKELTKTVEVVQPQNLILNNVSYTDVLRSGNTATEPVNTCKAAIKLDQTIGTVQSIVTQSIVNLIAQTPDAYYEWIDCSTGKTIPGESSQIYMPQQAGTYAVAITNAQGCQAISECYQVQSVGLVPNDFGNQIKVFPNPTSGSITVDLGGSFENVQAQVYTMTGIVVVDRTFPGFNNSFSLIIDDQPQGAYFVRLIDADGRMATLNIVKE